LITDLIGIEELIGDSIFTTDTFGNYQIEFSRELYKLELQGLVGIPDTSTVSEFKTNFTINIPPGFTFINQVEENTFLLDDAELERVKVQSGRFEVRLENPFETKVLFKLTLPDITIDGVVYSVLVEAPAGSLSSPTIIDYSFSLSQADLKLTGISGNEVSTIQSIIEVKSDPNGPSVQSTPNHITKVTTSFKEIVLDYAQGYFGQQKKSDTLTSKIDLFKNIESGLIDFPNSQLKIELRNSAKVIGKINITSISGKNKNGTIIQLQSTILNVNRNINSAVGSYGNYTQSVLSYDFNSQNSNLEQFLENLVSELTIAYTYELNPYGNISGSFDEVFGNEIFSIHADFKMPLNIGLDELVLGDTVSLNFGNNLERISKFESFEIVFTGTNSFLLDGELSFYFLDEKSSLLIEKVNSIRFPSGNSGANSTGVLPFSNFNSTVTFNAFDIRNLIKAKKVVIKAKLNTSTNAGTQNVPMVFNTLQKIKIQGVINGIYQNEIK
jgi:hypothetical protein